MDLGQSASVTRGDGRMKRWLRRAFVTAGLLTLVAGVFYEMATHVGRGWLRGEAFYADRPTSYWRSAAESWIQRFDAQADAEACLCSYTWVGMLSSTTIFYKPPRPAFFCTHARLARHDAAPRRSPAAGVSGHARRGGGARELESDETLTEFVCLARQPRLFIGW